MKKAVSLLLVLTLAIGLLAGCSSSDSSSNDAAEETEADRTETEAETKAENTSESSEVRDTINCQLWTECTSLDPQVNSSAYDEAVMYQIYDSLFDPVDGDYNNVTGALCESYEVDEAYMNWTLHIRQGVLWQNGDILTAEDVEFSINRMLESPVTMARISFITDVELVDEYTVQITCAYPSPRLPALFSTASMVIVNKKLVEEYGDSAQETVVGTGAYKLESWEPGGTITLTAFEEGWRGSPEIKTINYLLITDANAARIAFQNGELDIYTASNASDMELFANNDDYTMSPYTTSSIDSLAFNTSRTDSWVSNETFRQAVAYALDREMLVEISTDGLSTVADSVVAPGNAVYDEDYVYPYYYDPDKAEELLAECGYDGSPVSLMYTSTYTSSNSWATAVEGYLAAVGINVDMKGEDYSAVVQDLTDRNYDMTLFQYSVSFPDPLSSFYALYRSDGYYNVWQYITDDMDDLIISIYGILDDDERNAIMSDIDKWAIETCLYVPSTHEGGYVFQPAELKTTSVPEPMFGWTRYCTYYWE